MKRIKLFLNLFLLICLLIPNLLWAQAVSTGKISGRVLDKSKAQPVEFANVVVKRSGDSTVVKGVVTDTKGEFVIENLKFGRYDLTIFFVGYQKMTLTGITINPQGPNARLDKIELNEDSKQLAEIVVEGKTEFIQTTPDGIVITPSANPTQTGGTAADVLQQAPSVQVDANGGVTLRGGNPNILINGRNSSFGGGGGRGMGMGGMGGGGGGGLDQISADEIESIEINTNPSARFDADGVGGLINIRLKRDRQLGTHGNFNFNLGNRWRTGLGGRINHRTEKWNFFASYFGRLDKRLGEDLTERFTDTYTSLDPNIDRTYLSQTRDNRTVGQFHNVRAGVDYYFSEKESITFEAMYGFRDFESTGALRSRTLAINDRSFRLGNNQDNTTIDKGNNYEFSLNYKKEFAKKRQEMLASVTTSFGNGRQILDLVNQAVLADGSILNLPSNLTQNGLNANRNNTTSVQFDYSHPVGKNGLFETGYKGIIRTLNTDADWTRLNRLTQVFEPNTLINNEYRYNENVQAVYTAYKSKMGKFDYSLGLRFEQVWYGGNLTAENQKESFDRQYFNVFPTARIAYNINQKTSEFIKLSYSRRIDRPGFGDLNPFRDISNPLNIRLGNTNLQPELINVVELGYNKFWNKITINPNLFYRYRTNLVQRLSLPIGTEDAEFLNGLNLSEEQKNQVFVNSPINIGFSHSYGAEMIASAEITKWFTMNGSASFFRTIIEGGQMAEDLKVNINSSVSSWNLRGSLNFTPAKTWRIQMNAFYNSPQAVAQGERLGFYAVGFGVNKNLWNNKGGIGINIRDMFYTMIFGSTSFGQSTREITPIGGGAPYTQFTTFNQTSSVRRDTRNIAINFRYRF
jgi:outer membrane receptor protein involved in Fe transport